MGEHERTLFRYTHYATTGSSLERIIGYHASHRDAFWIRIFRYILKVKKHALTPPSSWYTDPNFLSLEVDRVFYRGWQVVGFTEQMRKAYDFFTGRLGRVEYVISRDENGNLHAFHNVCRHRASLISSGCGQKSCFVCPYHGWTYGMDGTLLKATRISRIENFSKNNFGLVPIQVSTWGPFILINLDEDIHHDYHQMKVIDTKTVEKQWLGSSLKILSRNGIDTLLSYVSRHEYTVNSNWKFFIDNFIDGGYHVPYAHTGFSSGFNLDTYTTTISDKFSIQECESAPNEKDGALSRIGSRGFYVFVFPNLLINRYGPWMETNRVYPIGPNKCQSSFGLLP
ncbi:hypothetical protein C5167_050937 [Papaver somniferum]|uniref:Choline monooxygenase, chloroplastic n=1 Tax=Papaver somniferum TaxID=3469 RepID=A0A4Y7KSX1_PAPSO|nr:hypothetical protein C5167_050937 [Papaver somniferum]